MGKCESPPSRCITMQPHQRIMQNSEEEGAMPITTIMRSPRRAKPRRLAQPDHARAVIATLCVGSMVLSGAALSGCAAGHTASTAQHYNGGNNGGLGRPVAGPTATTPTTPPRTTPSTSATPSTTTPPTSVTPATTAPVAVMPAGDSLGNMAVPGRPEYVAAQFATYFDGQSWKWGPWGWLPLAKPYMAPAFYATWLANSQNPTSDATEQRVFAPIEQYKETEYVYVDQSVLVDGGAATVNTSDVEGVQVTYNLSGETPAGVKEPINPQQKPFVQTYLMNKIGGKWYVAGFLSNGNG